MAGFQGVSPLEEMTTLGRGGSDTTAVALAAALGAESCEIYTDVEGVYTADPRLVTGALKLAALSYEEMLELAASGAKVLAVRSVEYARNNGVPLHVRSIVRGGEGTWIREEDATYGAGDHLGNRKRHLARRRSRSAACRTSPASPRRIFRPLADAGMNMDMIVQNVSAERRTDVSFTLPKRDLASAAVVLLDIARSVGGPSSRPTPRSQRCRSSAPA